MSVLVRELWPVVLAFAERGLHHEQDAEDVAQEVFLRICSRIADFDPERDGLSWAFGIASYEILTHRRRRVRRKELVQHRALDAQVDPSASQEDVAIRAELVAAMGYAFGHLSGDDQRTLAAKMGKGADVAAATLRKRRQRALERLRLIWRRLYGEP